MRARLPVSKGNVVYRIFSRDRVERKLVDLAFFLFPENPENNGECFSMFFEDRRVVKKHAKQTAEQQRPSSKIKRDFRVKKV